MTITTYQHRPVKGQPRPKHTYRAARRNDMRGLVWKGVAAKRSYPWPVYENKSQHRPRKQIA